MNKLMAVGMAAGLGLAVTGAAVAQQNYDLRAETLIGIAGDQNNRTMPVKVALGYYLNDQVQVGGYAGFVKKEWESYWGVGDLWDLGVFGQYDFAPWNSITPFANLFVGTLKNDKNDEAAPDRQYAAQLGGGARIALTETLAVSAQVSLHAATDDIYDYDRTGTGETGSGSETALSGSLAVHLMIW